MSYSFKSDIVDFQYIAWRLEILLWQMTMAYYLPLNFHLKIQFLDILKTNRILKMYLHSHVYFTIIHIARIWKQTSRILCSHEKEENPDKIYWMDFEGIMLSETSQTEKDSNCMIVIHGIYKSQICKNIE